MKVYLVGGAVRDQALGYPIKEQDWVVVGSSPEQLRAQGYQQVGSDFPVFLHPKTREEYALARTERKSAVGYYGFTCDFNENVSLEEDLARRDLTINAMAMDEDGQLIDPYNGMIDLQNKWLRHVSPAFIEDPVRVLRVARFAARYAHLGFRLANETRLLMYEMVKNEELNHLVPERVWQELQRSLGEKNPEVFVQTLRACDALRIVFPELDALFGVPNSVHYHPEVDSGVHTLMVLQAAVALTKDPIIRFAALVHDLGKARTPKSEWPRHHGHEERGVAVIEALAKRLRIPADYRNLAVLVSRLHLNIHRFFELRPNTIVKILEQADAFRRPQQLEAILLACKADANGCGIKREYPQAEQWLRCFDVCKKIEVQRLIDQGFQGKAIKDGLRELRIAAITKLLESS
jgi:tRNA nucleotidyltransferase (CCA-adding enzyme)